MNALSPYLLAIALGWIVAQGLKYLIIVLKTKKMRQLRQLYLSGNMPSAHTTSVISLVSVIALRDGVTGPVFGVAALFAAIVMYDAMMVRRSAGEQGVAIQELIKQTKSKVAIPRAAKGHTPAEVAVGALLGVLIGLVVVLATN